MESISQRVPQGERGPYRWGRGRGGPLYGEGQEGERRHKTCQPGRRSYWGKDRNIMGAEYSSWGLSVEFVIGQLWLLELRSFGWGGGPTHQPPWSLPFIQGLMTGKPSLLKCGFAHSPGDENPKFDRRAAFGRHTLTSPPPAVAAHSKSTNRPMLEEEGERMIREQSGDWQMFGSCQSRLGHGSGGGICRRQWFGTVGATPDSFPAAA